ncbi:TPA: hypothetical protein ACGO7F_001315 [Streptococcus suis]
MLITFGIIEYFINPIEGNGRLMKKQRKWVMTLCIIGLLACFYLPHLRVVNPVIALCLAVIHLYIIYVVSTLIHLLITRFLLRIPQYYMVIYPFIHEDEWRFHPFNLLYFPEMVRDLMPINLYLSYGFEANDKWLQSKVKLIRLSRELGFLLACLISYILLSRYQIYTVYSYVSLFLILYLQSFLGYGSDWIGNRAIICHEKLDTVFFEKTYLRELEPQHYEAYLTQSYMRLSFRELVVIFENYLDGLILFPNETEDYMLIEKILARLFKNYNLKCINEFNQLSYIIYQLGFLGKLRCSYELITITKTYLNARKRYLLEELSEEIFLKNILEKYLLEINEFTDYLEDKNTINHLANYLFLSKPVLFSKKLTVFSIIKGSIL